jgi:hypothetical protein
MRADGCRGVNGRRRTFPAMARALTRNWQKQLVSAPFAALRVGAHAQALR